MVEIQLGGATVTGIVYERDATTAVGAGTTVYLVPGGRETLTIDALQGGAGSTTTNAQGRYVLAIPETGRYTIQSERGTDRGRAELAATTLNPAQPYQANVVFLAKGSEPFPPKRVPQWHDALLEEISRGRVVSSRGRRNPESQTGGSLPSDAALPTGQRPKRWNDPAT